MRLCMTCSSRRSARQAHARVRSLATSPTPSVTSLKVLPADNHSAELFVVAVSFLQHLLAIEWSTKRVKGQVLYNLSFTFTEDDAVFDTILHLAAPALHGLAYNTVLKCLRMLLPHEIITT